MDLFDRIKAKFTGPTAPLGSGQSYQSIMATLVAVQTATSFQQPREAFPILMTDLKAAGYLFGFHDAFAQRLYGRNTDKCMTEIQLSYRGIFGEQAGRVLYNKAVVDQEQPEFLEGRGEGGNEMFAYAERGVHPLGLMNHLVFGSKEAAPKEIKKPSNALTKFGNIISSWEYEQARLAAALLAAIVKRDRGPIESIFGKGTTVEHAMGRLTVGNMRVLHLALKEIFAELGIDPDEDEDEDEDES